MGLNRQPQGSRHPTVLAVEVIGRAWRTAGLGAAGEDLSQDEQAQGFAMINAILAATSSQKMECVVSIPASGAALLPDLFAGTVLSAELCEFGGMLLTMVCAEQIQELRRNDKTESRLPYVFSVVGQEVHVWPRPLLSMAVKVTGTSAPSCWDADDLLSGPPGALQALEWNLAATAARVCGSASVPEAMIAAANANFGSLSLIRVIPQPEFEYVRRLNRAKGELARKLAELRRTKAA
jgi:hypothetical protein